MILGLPGAADGDTGDHAPAKASHKTLAAAEGDGLGVGDAITVRPSHLVGAGDRLALAPAFGDGLGAGLGVGLAMGNTAGTGDDIGQAQALLLVWAPPTVSACERVLATEAV